ncbi:MAG: AAA family ATPase [Methanobrevibacter sp.]|nr:AAA family ATPase [Methanobrevibacter sp.]
MKLKVKKSRQISEGKKLTEASLDDEVKKAENQIDNDKVVSGNKGQIEMALDRALSTAERQKRTGGSNYTNIILIGGAGTGKTSAVRDWAAANGINLVLQNTSTMDETDLTGVVARSAEGNSTVKLRSDVLRGLNQPRSVLFLDEYNRGRSSVRGTLLTLINDHLIDTGTDEESNVPGLTGKYELKNMLFTVAAINPASGEYTTDELDPAEISRFRRVEVKTDKKHLLNILTKKFMKQAEQEGATDEDRDIIAGQIGLLKKLLSDKQFQFDNEEDERAGYQKFGRDYTPLSPRSLTNLIAATDGTKEDFLDLYNDYCNPMKKNTMDMILQDYEDVDDKANSVFKKRELSNEEKLDNFLG